MTEVLRLSEFRRRDRRVYFDRGELTRLLSLYSTRVARGEWRDYAIDHTPGAAIFSIFRHSFDRPLFSIAKLPGQGGRCDYQLVSGRERLGRCATLDDILSLLERQLHVVGS
jgi:hypothetical protein